MTKPLPPPCPTPFSDHTFAVKHGVKVDLRVWPATDVACPAPFVMYIHGGAFCAGKHYLPNPWVIPGFHSKGIHVVSIAYRFAPQCSIVDMLEDCEDAYQWCLVNLASVALNVDVKRCIIAGESAGGTLATLLGHRLKPQPKVVVDIYGVVDFFDPRFEPDAPRHAVDIQPLTGPWTEAEVRAGIEEQDPSKAVTVCPFQFDTPEQTIAKLWGVPGYHYDEKQIFQYEMKKWLRTTNLLMRTILRYDQFEDKDSYRKHVREHSSLCLLDDVHSYPPTYLIHGEADPVVPIRNAYRIASRLKEMNVPVGESYEPDMVHEFDHKYTGREIEGWDKYIQPCLDFADRYARV